MKLLNQIYQDIICETNYILQAPPALLTYLKNKILNMKTQTILITFNELFENNCFDDWTTYNKNILDSIKNNLHGFIKICIVNNKVRGQFIPSEEFGKLNYAGTELNNKSITLLDSDSEYIKSLKQHINFKFNELQEDKQLLLEINKHLSKIKLFGTFYFNSFYITSNDKTNLNEFLFDEILEHECQHFCNLLISIAKTNQYYSRHFDKSFNINNKYNLDEDEFITLFGSYNNWLCRFYSNNKLSDLNTFVHCLLAFVFKPSQENIYSTLFKKYKIMSEIKTFYIDIWKSEQFQQITEPYSKNKYQTLLKWTYKNLKENLNNEKI